MLKKQTLTFLALAIAVVLLAPIAYAQSSQTSQHRAPWAKLLDRGIELYHGSAPPPLPEEAQAPSQPGSQLRLEGTWELDELFAPDQPDHALFTFSAGPDADHGTVVMSDMFIFTGNPSCITAQGAWKRIGNASFVGKHKCFAFDDDNGFAPDGFVIWRYAMALSADGNSAFGKTVLDFYDADGNYLFSGIAALQGTRMDPQSPPR